jgi:hypothetical protein
MDIIKNWNLNLEQINIDNPHVLGFAYLTGCVSKVLSVIHNKPQEISAIIPIIKENSTLPINVDIMNQLGSEIFIELLFAGKAIDKENLIQIPERFKIISFINATNPYYHADSNFWTINCSYRDLINNIGAKLENYNLSKEQSLVLGFSHAEMKLHNLSEQKAYIGAVILSNIQPTYLANIMNTFPLPEEYCSNPDKWVFSKEIYSRLMDKKYNLDNQAMEWVMRFHEFLFFDNPNDLEEIKTKHDSIDVLKNMIQNIYTQISKFNDQDPLYSKKLKFVKKYTGQDNWKDFLREWEINYSEDFGATKIEQMYCMGEFYSHYSFRFIHAVLLFLEKKKRFGLF